MLQMLLLKFFEMFAVMVCSKTKIIKWQYDFLLSIFNDSQKIVLFSKFLEIILHEKLLGSSK